MEDEPTRLRDYEQLQTWVHQRLLDHMFSKNTSFTIKLKFALDDKRRTFHVQNIVTFTARLTYDDKPLIERRGGRDMRSERSMPTLDIVVLHSVEEETQLQVALALCNIPEEHFPRGDAGRVIAIYDPLLYRSNETITRFVYNYNFIDDYHTRMVHETSTPNIATVSIENIHNFPLLTAWIGREATVADFPIKKYYTQEDDVEHTLPDGAIISSYWDDYVVHWALVNPSSDDYERFFTKFFDDLMQAVEKETRKVFYSTKFLPEYTTEVDLRQALIDTVNDVKMHFHEILTHNFQRVYPTLFVEEMESYRIAQARGKHNQRTDELVLEELDR